MSNPRRHTMGMMLFWGLMVLCSVLTVVCVHTALRQLGQPWAGFTFHHYGGVMQTNETSLVFFDTILAVDGQPIRRGDSAGAAIRAIIQRTPEGTPLTYQVQRGQMTLTVTVPVQRMTWHNLLYHAGIAFLVALGQLAMGALVFLLRPNTQRSWSFFTFCLAWFGLFMTYPDFQTTHIFKQGFLFCWFMTSAVFLHLAFVFPDTSPFVRRHPQRQYLLYLPSLALWGLDRLCDHVLPKVYVSQHLGLYITQLHAIYWLATLTVLLVNLTHTACWASSPVARRRAGIVCLGFAAGFITPIGSESLALLFHVNLVTECLWLLTLLLPLSITYAILRYNLFDIGAIVLRTLTYGTLSGLVIAAYVLLVWMSNSLLNGLPFARGHGFPILFALLVLFVINPLRQCLQEGLDRLFFRTRYDFRRTIETLSQELTTLLNLEEIAQRVVRTVMQALEVSSVALYLDDGSGTYQPLDVAGEATEKLAGIRPLRNHPVVTSISQRSQGISRYDMEANPALLQEIPEAPQAFDHLGIVLALPLLFKEELVGMLVLGAKKSGVVFTENDLELLRTLSNQSAIALANARSYRSLEATNEALRTALRKIDSLENIKLHLGKFVPAAVRQIIERDPTAPALDKQDQDVTVLFLDIAGYTRLSETLDHERVNYLIERYFSSFLDDIYANRGDINETAGDGLMIIFQDNNPQQHACAAVRTALAIRDKAQAINAELAAMYDPITINMGINSGRAAVGSTKFESAIGTRWTFTASGPVTNLAARLAAYATNGTIYIGVETAQRLAETFVLRHLGPQHFKNVRDPVVVYEVLQQQRTFAPSLPRIHAAFAPAS